MKKILTLILALTMVFSLTACTMPAMTNPDGTDTIAGVAIKNGLNILEAACVTALTIAAAVWAKKGGEQKNFQNIILAVSSVLEMARLTVGELKQDMVDQLKEISATGKLTPEQVKEINAELLARTLKKLSEPTKHLLDAVGIDICALIMGAGEDWVRELKVQNGIALDQLLEVPGIVEGNTETEDASTEAIKKAAAALTT